MQLRETCNCCGHNNLSIVWDLPNLPLTGIYLTHCDLSPANYFFNQTLLLCNACSHMQLSKAVDASYLYIDTYTHETTLSPISRRGNDFLLQFIQDTCNTLDDKVVVDFGCNDGYLLKQLSKKSRKLFGIDPYWINKDLPSDSPITFIGAFGENVASLGFKEREINILISAHTFEHLVDPSVVLSQFQNLLCSEGLFFIEVPSSDRMLEQLRLDQVFHQHVNYYSRNSLLALMERFGMYPVAHRMNYSYWGGTQLWCFSSTGVAKGDGAISLDFKNALEQFGNSIDALKFQMSHTDKKWVGFGAAQMLPTLAYHLGDAFSLLDCVIDDNKTRQGKYFPGLSPMVVPRPEPKHLENRACLVTALDSSRAILREALPLPFSDVYVPLKAA